MSGGRAQGSIRFARCAYHGDREAVAFCRGCAQSFCRECVTEHEGTIYCGHCLVAALQTTEPGAGAGVWGGLLRMVLGAAGFALVAEMAYLALQMLASTHVQRLAEAARLHGR